MDGAGRAVCGFLHYRSDLGDGMQSAVFFDSCDRKCRRFCDGRFLTEHGVGIDRTEKRFYTSDELIAYLLEEKKWCASRKLGISFLGAEPLADPWYCLRVAGVLKREGMRVTFRTCGNLLPSNLLIVRDVTDLYLFDFLTMIPTTHRAFSGFPLQRSLDALFLLDRAALSYRLRIRILPEVNEKDPAVFASFCRTLRSVKSVILDFQDSALSLEEQRQYRNEFLKQGVVLY